MKLLRTGERLRFGIADNRTHLQADREKAERERARPARKTKLAEISLING